MTECKFCDDKATVYANGIWTCKKHEKIYAMWRGHLQDVVHGESKSINDFLRC